MSRPLQFGIALLLLGCTVDRANDDRQPGNPRLGIASFRIVNTEQLTTVVGLAENGTEVGRLDLIHGRFALSPAFAEGYRDPWVVGRSLHVAILGQEMRWETAGFEPKLRLPAHPRGQWAIAAFLEDEHVRPILAEWKIGFDGLPPAEILESTPPGFECLVNGTHPRDCSGLHVCPTMFLDPSATSPVACGSPTAEPPTSAIVVHQRGVNWDGRDSEPELHGNDYFVGNKSAKYNQSFIQQCCPGRTPFFGIKACPDQCASDTCPNDCGDPVPFGSCKACQQYVVATDKCLLAVVEAGWIDPHAPLDLAAPSGDDKRVRNVCRRVAWTCGDGICDVDETCASCSADCC